MQLPDLGALSLPNPGTLSLQGQGGCFCSQVTVRHQSPMHECPTDGQKGPWGAQVAPRQ